jgi:hypothetical protein
MLMLNKAVLEPTKNPGASPSSRVFVLQILGKEFPNNKS